MAGLISQSIRRVQPTPHRAAALLHSILNSTSQSPRILTNSAATLLDPRRSRRRALSPLATALLAAAAFLPGTITEGADGVWQVDGNGNWGAAANWLGGVPNAAGNIANFSTLDITANRTINLNANRTAGTLVFGDASGAQTWTVANGGTGTGNKVTLLGAGSTAGTIEVVNNTATISAILEATQGFTKIGAGTLALTNAANNISNGIALNAGTLSFVTGALGAVSPANLISVGGNAGLTWNGNTDDISSRIKLGDGFTLTLSLSGTASDVTTFATALQTGAAGTGGIIKGNASTLIITAANTYLGGTRVNNGRLILSGGDNRLSIEGGLSFGSAANSGVVQLGDASAASNQTVTSLAITGNVNSTANAIVGGHTTNSVLTVNNAANITAAHSPILGGGGANENNFALVKSGAGSLSLSKTNTFLGSVDLIGGALVVTNNSSLGAGPKTVTISGTANAPSLQLNNASGVALASSISLVTSNDAVAGAIVNTAGNNVIGGSITLADGGFGGTQTRIRVNAGSLTLNGAISASATATSDRTLILDGAGHGTATGVISDGGAIRTSVTKEGAGTWTLTGANSYHGETTVNGGRVNITTAQTGTGVISVAEGAALGLTLAAAGQTLSPNALTLSHTSVGTALALDLGGFSNPAAPLITTGVFTTVGAGANVIDIAGTGLSVGTFDLISYTGGIGGSGFGGLALGSKPARVTAELVDGLGKVQLSITAFDVPKWTGAVNGDWDVNDEVDPTTGSGTVNWKEANSGAATRYLQIGSTVDSVLFDDTATGATDVNLTTSLAPASVTVDNSVLAYTFGGAGKLTGSTSLLKSGAGTLILVNSGGNDYTGATTVNAGKVQIGDGVTLDGGQLGSGNIVLGAAGTLALKRPGDAGQDMTLANVFSGSGTIAQEGGNILTLSGNSSAFDGVINILSGTLKAGSANALGSTVGGTNVSAGAILDITGFSLPETIALNGGTLKHLSGTSGVSSGLTLAGGGIIDSAAGTLGISGGINGVGGLTKNGAGNLLLSAVNSFTGAFVTNGGVVTLANLNTFDGGLTANAGTVILSANQAYTGGTIIGGGATLQIGANAAATVGNVGAGDIALNSASGLATLTIFRSGAFELANAITSSGDNATNAVVIGGTGAGSLSGTVALSGANTFTGNITINGGALRITAAAALGVGPKLLRIASNAGPALKLDGALAGITLPSDVSFAISSDGAVANAAANGGAIVNVAGDNLIEGRISQINGGGGNGRILVEAGTLTLAGNIDAEGATGARTLLLGGPATGFVTGVISDLNSAATSAVSLQKDGSGTWLLLGLNEFTGSVSIQSGTLKVSIIDSEVTNAQSLGTGTSAITLGTATAAGLLEYIGTNAATLSRGLTVNGVGGGIVKNSSGQLLTLAGTLTKNGRPLTLTEGSFEITGAVVGANVNSDLIVDGSTVTLSSASNTYNGPTRVIGGGVLKNGLDNAVPSSSSTVILGEAANNTSGTYDLNGFSQTLTGLTTAGTGAHLVTNSAVSGTSVLTHTGTSTFDGVIQDGATAQVAVTKDIGGTFTLTGANTYTGATTVNAGTLLIGGSIAGSIATVTGATSTLGGTGTIGDVTVDAGASLQGGDGVVASGVLSSAGNVTLNDGATIKLTLGTNGTHSSIARLGGTWIFDLDQVFSLNIGAEAGIYDNIITGLTGSELGLANIAAWTALNPEYFGSSFSYDGAGGVDLQLQVVPEPGAAVSLLGSVGLLLGWQRRRANTARSRPVAS